MASAWVTASPAGRRNFLRCVLLLGLLQHVSSYTPETLKVTCRDTIDLRGRKLDSGLVESELPERIPIYPNEDQYCDIFLSFSEGSEMMFYFDFLDLHSSGTSRCDSTNVEFYDGSSNTFVQGLKDPVCGRLEEMPTGVYYVLNNLLIIRANSKGVVQGSGFRLHFTVYRRGFPCNREEFSCENYDAHSGAQGFKRCIQQDLVCDDWNDCGDWADEYQNCNDLTVGAIVAIVLVALGIVALVVGLVIFCKLRRQWEIRRLGEKEAADTSFSSSRGGGGGLMSPFSISNETLEKDKYTPRYATGRNSSRRGQAPGPAPTRAPDYEEYPPPYTEKPSRDEDDEDDDDDDRDDERPRSRQKPRRGREPDEVFEDEDEDEAPRMRRGRNRSQDERLGSSGPRDDRYPSRRDERDSPRTDRHHSRDLDDRRPGRDDRYPSRREDDRDRPAGRYDDRDRDRDRPPSRYDERDRDRDRPPSRYDQRERDRDRPPSRYDQRERDRDRPPSRHDDRDRERDPRRERPSSRSGAPRDRFSSEHEDDMMDQLHPLRDMKRRSMHTDSDPDTSREERRAPRDRSREDDDRHPLRDERPHQPRDSDHRHPPRDDRDRRDDLHPPRGRDARSSPRESDREDRPGRDRDERPRDRNSRGPPRDDRPPASRSDRPERQRERPSSRAPDDSYEDVEYRGRPPRQDSPPLPPPPPLEEDPEDSPPRNRRRRSRSREDPDRSRSSRHGDNRREEDRDRAGRGKSGGEEGGRPRVSYGGFREESV